MHIGSFAPQHHPIARHIALSLARALHRHHVCLGADNNNNSNGSGIELECRVGSFRPQGRLRLAALPISFEAMTVLAKSDQHLIKFQPGIDRVSYAIIKKGICAQALNCMDEVGSAASSSSLASSLPLPDSSSSGLPVSRAFIVRGEGGSAENTTTTTTTTARLTSGLSQVRLEYGIGDGHMATLSHISVKKAFLELQKNVCCPEWAYDFRLAVSSESLGISGAAAAENEFAWNTFTPLQMLERWRYTVSIAPYFSLQYGVDIHVPMTKLGVASLGPTMNLMSLRTGQRHTKVHHSVELEVVMSDVYRDWKKTQKVCSFPKEPNPDGIAIDELDALCQVERDAFLMKVSTDMLSVMQYLCQRWKV